MDERQKSIDKGLLTAAGEYHYNPYCKKCGYKKTECAAAFEPGESFTHFLCGRERGDLILGQANFIKFDNDIYKCPRCGSLLTLKNDGSFDYVYTEKDFEEHCEKYTCNTCPITKHCPMFETLNQYAKGLE